MSIPTTLAILASLIALCGCAAETAEPPPVGELDGDLEPMQSALIKHTSDYQVRLRQVLVEKAPDFCDLQFLVIPSFQPETLLSLYQVGHGYEAQVLTPKQQIWGFEGGMSEIECREAKKSLPVQTAERLCAAWKQMLLRTRHTVSPHQVLDGVGYAFIRYERGLGHWSGESSNPEQGTRPYVLAEIGEAIVAYVQADSAAEQNLLTRVTKSLEQLEASLTTK